MKTKAQRRIAAVVLAAGASTRFGSPKQLADWDGEPLVRRAAQAAIDAGADPVFVVLGADAERVAPALDGMRNVRCLTNPGWKSGLASSLAAGMRAVLGEAVCDATLVSLADQPLVDGAALASLVAEFGNGHRLVASSYSGVIGVPALFGREFFEELITLTGDAGAGGWLRARLQMVTVVSLKNAALDIDTRSDKALLT